MVTVGCWYWGLAPKWLWGLSEAAARYRWVGLRPWWPCKGTGVSRALSKCAYWH